MAQEIGLGNIISDLLYTILSNLFKILFLLFQILARGVGDMLNELMGYSTRLATYFFNLL